MLRSKRRPTGGRGGHDGEVEAEQNEAPLVRDLHAPILAECDPLRLVLDDVARLADGLEPRLVPPGELLPLTIDEAHTVVDVEMKARHAGPPLS